MQGDYLGAAVVAGLAIIGLASSPAGFHLARQLTKREPKQNSYEDEDGKATPESLKAYSAKWPKTLIVIFAALAAGAAIATAIVSTLATEKNDLLLEDWLGTGASVNMSNFSWCCNKSKTNREPTDFHPVPGHRYRLEQEVHPGL